VSDTLDRPVEDATWLHGAAACPGMEGWVEGTLEGYLGNNCPSQGRPFLLEMGLDRSVRVKRYVWVTIECEYWVNRGGKSLATSQEEEGLTDAMNESWVLTACPLGVASDSENGMTSSRRRT